MDTFDNLPNLNSISPQELAEWYEQKETAEEAAKNLYFRTVIGCPINKHQLAKACFACRHCRMQDEVHPDGIVLLPNRMYLCVPCLALMERRKFKVMTDGIATCRACVMEEVDRIMRIDPAKFKDLREDIDDSALKAFAMSLGLI